MDRLKIALMTFVLSLSLVSFGQVGISLGYSALKGFSNYKAHNGLSLGFEIPRDDAMTLYGRFTHYFRNLYPQDSLTYYLEPRDWTSGYNYSYTTATPGMNANVIEGGTRYYIGDGYDNGFAAYGGSSLMVLLNKISYKIDPYDEVNYVPSTSSNYQEGSIFSLGFGLEGGVKYSMPPYGTIYADLGFTYVIFNTTSIDPGYLYLAPYRGLYFAFNIGFRRDLLW